MNPLSIDINCDMGESFGNFKIGNDEKIFPFISSCNIACGFHGGDPLHIEETIKGALAHGVQIGAHPSYPDLAGFGRRPMQIKKAELKAIIKYQICALKGMTESLGGRLVYVKPHGALYNTAAKDKGEAIAIIEAIQEVDADLFLLGLAGSPIAIWAAEAQVPFVGEAFADRQYGNDGHLRSRNQEGALITNADQAAAQVLSIVLSQKVQSNDGHEVPVSAKSICIHGDNPAALAILAAIEEGLKVNNIVKAGFGLWK